MSFLEVYYIIFCCNQVTILVISIHFMCGTALQHLNHLAFTTPLANSGGDESMIVLHNFPRKWTLLHYLKCQLGITGTSPYQLQVLSTRMRRLLINEPVLYISDRTACSPSDSVQPVRPHILSRTSAVLLKKAWMVSYP